MEVWVLTHSELFREIEQLSYRDKFPLTQLLIQLARKEEEEQNPEQRHAAMFHFQRGISDGEKERMFSELQKRGHIVVAENSRVQYPRVTRG